MQKREEMILENIELIQELLGKIEEDLTRRIKLVEKARNERPCSFSRFSRALKSTQTDLENLHSLINELQIKAGPECYHIIYRGGEIKSVEAYRRCTKAYEVRINNLGLEENIVFSECKTSVNALIQALPLILVDEE